MNGDFYWVVLKIRDIKYINWKEYKSEWKEIDRISGLDEPVDCLDYFDNCPFTKEEIEDCEVTYY